MPKYEVKKDGVNFFSTKYASCFYSDDMVRKIVASGYKIYKDGKIYHPKSKKKTEVVKT